LNASFENAERIKREYGYAISSETSADEFFPVETIGKKDPIKVDEHYLSEIIEARVVQTFETVKRALDQVEALKLPGGIVLTGGASSLAGVQELAQEIFGVQVKTYIPEQMGMRNPIYATSMGLIQYAASLDDVHRIAQKGKPGVEQRPVQSTPKSAPVQVQPTAPVQQPQDVEQEASGEEQGFGAKVKNFFKMFIDEN
jgi:cell division protein ftsA